MIPLSSITWTVLGVLVPLVDEVPDPEDVKPGWLGFGVFLLLAAALVFLAFSFRKQLRKVDFDEDGDHTQRGAPETGPADGEQGPRRP